MRVKRKTTWIIAVLLSIAMTASTSFAQNVAWDVQGPAPWSDDLSWDLMLVPAARFGDIAVFSNGGTATVDEAVDDVTGLVLSDGAVHIQQGGSLTVLDTDDEFDGEGQTVVGASGRLRLSGNGAFTTDSLISNGVIELDISTNGSPVINVENTAQLGGTVLANLDADEELSYGQAWEFLQAGDITGQFEQVALPPSAPALGRGLDLQVSSQDGTASLVVGNTPVLMLDRASGQAQIRNVVGDPLSLTAYSIVSESGLLQPQGWNSLQSQNTEGWTEANPRDQAISELNLTSASTLELDSALNLGMAYNPQRGVHPSEEDVTFQYVDSDGRILNGQVEYTGPANDLVLRINPEDGQGVMRNLSSFIDPLDVTGYSIVSEGGALSVDGWTSLADSGAAGEWLEANPRAEAINELSLTGSQLFTSGTVVDLGTLFTPGSPLDLEFRFTTSDRQLRSGTVEYGPLDDIQPPSGDCNGDGVVNIQDANCTAEEQLDAFLAGLDPPSIRGDVDGNGAVEFADFLVLSSNFGNQGQYTDADFNKDGSIQFADFLILSSNFGQSGGGGVAAAVPEPASGLCAFLGIACALGAGRRRRLARD